MKANPSWSIGHTTHSDAHCDVTWETIFILVSDVGHPLRGSIHRKNDVCLMKPKLSFDEAKTLQTGEKEVARHIRVSAGQLG
jgi:hypothetical protein